MTKTSPENKPLISFLFAKTLKHDNRFFATKA